MWTEAGAGWAVGLVELRVTHPDRPEDAAAAAVELLERANINAVRDGDLISISDTTRIETAIVLLEEAGFEVRNLGGYAND